VVVLAPGREPAEELADGDLRGDTTISRHPGGDSESLRECGDEMATAFLRRGGLG
jgi:hypothetical protein